ncbi:MAG: sigma 54-interacting transcriptional regulator [Planctomycetota bacterium]|nr:sigma 54-interacting transcriptional regulator [Planctomycetota bacterium]
MPRLVFEKSGVPVQSFEFDEPRVTLGRGAENDIVLADLGDKKIHRAEHARIERRQSHWFLVTPPGRNPMMVNGAPGTETRLRHGDEVRLGDTYLTFHEGQNQEWPRARAERTPQPEPLIESESTIVDAALARELTSVQSTNRLSILLELARWIRDGKEINDVSERLLDALLYCIKAASGVVAMFEESGAIVPLSCIGRISGQLPVSDAMLKRVRSESKGALATAGDTEVFFAGDGRNGSARGTSMCVPIEFEGEILGIIAIAAGVEGSFGLDELDFLVLAADQFGLALSNQRLKRSLRRERRKQVEQAAATTTIIGKSPAIREVLQTNGQFANFPDPSQMPVLITGETGTGKELVARDLHVQSNHRDGPFIALNAAAIPDSLAEAELFGIEKNVASGVDARIGAFEKGNNGVLFLDEITEMPLPLQSKLLRALQERTIQRVGGDREIPVKVFVIAAGNKNPQDEVADGRFREDLYFRLKGIEIHIPPLRERIEDIGALAMHFLDFWNGEMAKEIRSISDEAVQYLCRYEWPGNVRELKTVIAQAAFRCQSDSVRPEHLPANLMNIELEAESTGEFLTLSDLEREHLAKVLKAVNWNKTKAARILGVSRQTLYDKIDHHGVVQ